MIQSEIKNRRVYDDCHTAIKFIAKIAARQIVLRDNNHFHSQLKRCLCSWNDLWWLHYAPTSEEVFLRYSSVTLHVAVSFNQWFYFAVRQLFVWLCIKITSVESSLWINNIRLWHSTLWITCGRKWTWKCVVDNDKSFQLDSATITCWTDGLQQDTRPPLSSSCQFGWRYKKHPTEILNIILVTIVHIYIYHLSIFSSTGSKLL